MKSKRLNTFQFLTVCIAPALAGIAAPSASAATRTWDGGAATNVLNTPTNWSDDTLPTAPGDIAQWNGTVPGPLSLTSTGAWTPTGGNGGGTSILVTSAQTDALTLSPTQNLGLGATVDIQSGAGPVTISPTAQLVFRGGNATITNDSANLLTFGSSLTNWNNGGGADRTVTFAGSGNTQIDGNFVLGGQGSFTILTKSGAGKLTLNGAQNGQLTGVGSTMASLVISAGTLKFGNAAQIATGGTLGNYSSAITNNGILEWASSASQTLSGIISGGGTINQSAGILTLTGANTFSGTTTITGGSLILGGTGSLPSSIIVNGPSAKYLHNSTTASAQNIALTQGTVGGNGTINAVTVADNAGATVANGNGSGGSGALSLDSLTFNGDGAITITDDGDRNTSGINVAGTLVTTPANGQVTINASNVFWTGGLTYNLITAGTFGGSITDFAKGSISGLTSRQSATLVRNGSTIGLQIAGDSPKWSGLDNGNWVVGSTGPNGNWKLISGGTKTDYIQGDVVLFDNSPTNTTVTISAANVSPAIVTYNATKNYILKGAFGITTGSLNKSGTGSVTISTPNTYSGGTTINAGSIILSGAGTLGATSGSLTIVDGTLNLGGSIQTLGPVAITGSAAITNGALAASGLTATTPFGLEAVISSDLDLGTGNLSKSDDGTLTLSGVTTYSGTTAINGGILVLAGSGSLGTSSSVTLNGGSLNLGGTSQTTNAITISATPTLVGDTILNGSITPTAFTVNTTNGITTVSANILGSTGITRSGGGILSLTGVNTFTGLLNQTGPGTVSIDGGSNSGGGAIAYNSFGTTFTINSGSYSTSGITTNGLSEFRSLNVNSGTLESSGNLFAPDLAISIIINGGTLRSTNATGITVFDYNNLVDVNAAGATFDTTGGNITVGNNPTMLATGNVPTPTVNLPKVNGTGGGNITLMGGNSLISGITNNGILDIQNSSTWNLNGIASSVTGLSGGGTVTNSSTAAVLTLNVTAGPHTYSGTLAGGANLSLVKQGAGTQTLSGSNTYQGNTTVTAGTLEITNNSTNTFADTSTVSIASGAVLNLPNGTTDLVSSLVLDGVVQASGVYSSTTPGGFITGSGKIQVGAASGYANWASANGLSAGVNDGTGQDPDFDGISNLLEYVLGGLPIGTGAANTSILPVQTVDATNITLTFKRSDGSEADTTQVVQISTNLSDWSNFATVGATTSAPVTVTEDSPTPDLDTVSVVIPRASNAANGKLFTRLQAVKQP